MINANRTVFFFLCLLIISTIFSFPVHASDKPVAVQPQSCSTLIPSSTRLSEKLYNLPGLENVGRISPCVFRGKQPTPEGYKTLKEMGIKTVINLRASHGEKSAVEAAGMRYLEFQLSMTNGIRKEKFSEIVRAMVDPQNQPVYVHCALGQDRTGVIVAAYRMDVDNWSLEDAEKEMQSFGFNDTWVHLKKSLRKYAAQKRRQG